VKTELYGRILFGASAVLFGVIALMWHDPDTWQNLQQVWRLPFGTIIGGCLMTAQITGGIGMQYPGQTPLDYITDWRMQKATQLLNQQDKKLAEIALSVGYESDAAFSKAFKRVGGAGPAEYRRNGIKGPQQGMA
jgi:hypothetical protein